VLVEFGFGVSKDDIEMMSSAHSADSVLLQLAPVLEKNPARLKKMLDRLSELTAQNMHLVRPTMLVERIPDFARKYLLAAATNRKGSARLVLKKFGIEAYFSAVITALDAPPKPNPAMIKLAMKAMGVKPSETVFVGDNAEDRMAGQAAGVRVILLNACARREDCELFLREFV